MGTGGTGTTGSAGATGRGTEHAGSFLTTRWSVVRDAAGDDPARARDALAVLCETSWYPLYAYVRRRGYGPDDALDCTQAFFARLLEKRDLGGADPGRGRFRAYLLGALKHFLAGERRRERAEKRGGGRAPLSLDPPLDPADAESRYGLEPAHGETPERAFERDWARALIERTFDVLGRDYARAGKASVFEALRGELLPADAGRPRAAIAAELGMEEGAVKVALHRLRRRFGEQLRREIGETLPDRSGVDEELGRLLAALGRD